jgi:hypothetical protein
MITSLLIIVVAGCVLTLAVHFGRDIWARTRTMQRHKHALDTLAGITNRADGDTAQGGLERQAHVRVVGPGTQADPDGAPVLPPPRVFSSLGPGRTSPFLRPSRMAPSAAAMEVAATADRLEPEPTTKLVRTAPPRPLVGRAERHVADTVPRTVHRPSLDVPLDEHVDKVVLRTALPRPPVGRPIGEHTEVLPSPGAAGLDASVLAEPPTMPVPVVRPEEPVGEPEVFFFDDLTRPSEVAAARQRRTARRRDKRRSAGHKQFSALGNQARQVSKTTLARALSAAAVLLAVIAIAIGLARTWSPGPASPVSAGTHKTTHTSSPLATSTTTPTSPPTTAPLQPAVLLSTAGSTTTYQLHSPSASIVVTASGPCWLEVKVGSPAGQVVYEGTLAAGQRSSVTGPAWLRLGDPPNVSVTVNGTVMTVPGATVAVPINLQFTLG